MLFDVLRTTCRVMRSHLLLENEGYCDRIAFDVLRTTCRVMRSQILLEIEGYCDRYILELIKGDHAHFKPSRILKNDLS